MPSLENFDPRVEHLRLCRHMCNDALFALKDAKRSARWALFTAPLRFVVKTRSLGLTVLAIIMFGPPILFLSFGMRSPWPVLAWHGLLISAYWMFCGRYFDWAKPSRDAAESLFNRLLDLHKCVKQPGSGLEDTEIDLNFKKLQPLEKSLIALRTKLDGMCR